MAGVFRLPYVRPHPLRWIPTVPPAGGNVTIVVDTPGAVTWTGQSVSLKTSLAVTAGAITWTGSSLALVAKITPTSGAITWAGQAIGLKTTITPTAGAITWNGQALGLITKIIPTQGNITWAGATDIVLQAGGNVVVNVDVPGAITWMGQAVGLRTSLAITAGAITWAGSSIGLTTTVIPSAGAITWTGSTITLVIPGQAEPVKGPTRKSSLVGISVGISAPMVFENYDEGIYDGIGFYDEDVSLFPPNRTSLAGDDNDAEELVVGVPRAAIIGSGKNELVEV